jgi:monoamine oxidase
MTLGMAGLTSANMLSSAGHKVHRLHTCSFIIIVEAGLTSAYMLLSAGHKVHTPHTCSFVIIVEAGLTSAYMLLSSGHNTVVSASNVAKNQTPHA